MLLLFIEHHCTWIISPAHSADVHFLLNIYSADTLTSSECNYLTSSRCLPLMILQNTSHNSDSGQPLPASGRVYSLDWTTGLDYWTHE